jgi:hypothetical protein
VGVSIYYSAKRDRPLSAEEQARIQDIVDKYSVETQIDKYIASGEGPNWQSFCVYDSDPDDPTEPGVVFEGATGLPTNSDDAIRTGVEHWCMALSEIRRAVSDAEWSVHIEDCPIRWDHKRQQFAPWT